MTALEALEPTIFNFTEKGSSQAKKLEFPLFPDEFDNILFVEYILPQYDWAWQYWAGTGYERFLDLSLFRFNRYMESIKPTKQKIKN